MNLQYVLSIDNLITGIVALIFGFIVLSKNRKNIVNITLFLLTLSTSIWALGYWQWLSEYESSEIALFWTRILSIGSSFIPVFYFHWIVALLNVQKKKKKILIFFYTLPFICLIFSFSEYFISGVAPYKNYFTFWPKPGFLYTIDLFFFFLIVLYAIILLFKSLKKATGLQRSQIKYILVGSILGFGGGATNFFLWYDIPILPIGNFLVILYPILFSYSIIKHRLMDIKVVLRKSSIMFLTLIFLFVITLPILVVADVFLKLKVDYYLNFIVLICIVFLFPFVKNYISRLSNKYFFTSLYDSQELVYELSQRLRSTLDIERIYNYIYNSLDKTMHIRAFGVLSYVKDDDNFSIQYNKGFGEEFELLKKYGTFLSHISQFNDILIMDEILDSKHNSDINKTVNNFATEMKNIGVSVILPLKIKDKMIGIIVLGVKESGDIYDDNDISVLNVISTQVAIIFENALLFKETLSFNVKLKDEVEKQTAELRSANEKLKKLDQAKSEFISIASHQLRTPLTVIKGYISMLLEGNFGELDEKFIGPLSKTFESSERLIDLIEDLLSISRIESGRMHYTFGVRNLRELVDSVMDELSSKAKEKNLKLVYKLPKKELPFVYMDTEKIRQVVMNLVDNSIKYTPKGKVVVKMSLEKNYIRFEVSDTGMGIAPKDMQNLFKKFSRGKDSTLTHTEGTGLGLYVARKLIDKHNGKVWAESEGVNKGSRFIFLIPYLKKNEVEKYKKIEAKEKAAAAKKRKEEEDKLRAEADRMRKMREKEAEKSGNT